MGTELVCQPEGTQMGSRRSVGSQKVNGTWKSGCGCGPWREHSSVRPGACLESSVCAPAGAIISDRAVNVGRRSATWAPSTGPVGRCPSQDSRSLALRLLARCRVGVRGPTRPATRQPGGAPAAATRALVRARALVVSRNGPRQGHTAASPTSTAGTETWRATACHPRTRNRGRGHAATRTV